MLRAGLNLYVGCLYLRAEIICFFGTWQQSGLAWRQYRDSLKVRALYDRLLDVA